MNAYTEDSLSNYIVHKTKVDFVRRVVQPPIHIVQYDDQLPLVEVELFKDGKEYDIKDNLDNITIKMRWVNPDGSAVDKLAFGYKAPISETDGINKVYFNIEANMTYLYGIIQPVIFVILGGNIAYSSSFGVSIDKNPIDLNRVIPPTIEDLLSAVAFSGDFNDLKNKPADYASVAIPLLSYLPTEAGLNGQTVVVATESSHITYTYNSTTGTWQQSNTLDILRTTDVIDSLTSTLTNKPLSAAKGKILNDSLSDLSADVEELDSSLNNLSNSVSAISTTVQTHGNSITSLINLTDGLADVAFSGSYNDLTDKPTIPANVLLRSDVIDNLTSEAHDKPVSAYQAYLIKRYLDSLSSSISDFVTMSTVQEITAEKTFSGNTIFEGLVYLESGNTPFLLSKQGKIGMRATNNQNQNLGQINISNSWYDEDHYGAQMSAAYITEEDDEEVLKYNAIRISHNGPQYIDENDVAHKLLTEDDSNTTWATYGVTTYAQIQSYINDGKVVYCNYNDTLYRLVNSYLTGQTFPYVFSCIDGNVLSSSVSSFVIQYLICNTNSNWSASSISENIFEHISNKVHVIPTSEPADTNEYFDAKVVYNMIQEVREIAEGRAVNYVTNTTQMEVLASNTNPITITSPTVFKDKNGNVISFNKFKVGDNVYVEDLIWPDRWVSAVTSTSLTLNILETTKEKVTDVTTIDGVSIVQNSVAVLPLIPTNTNQLVNGAGFITANDLSWGRLNIVSYGLTPPTSPESFGSTIMLHQVAKTGSYTSLLNKPTKLSDFTNDSGFITAAAIPTDVSDFNNDAGYITASSLPTKLSELTNDTNFITGTEAQALIPTVVSAFENDAGYITEDSIEPGVEYITIGEAAYSEIKEALDAGKIVVGKWGTNYAYLTYKRTGNTNPENDYFEFASTVDYGTSMIGLTYFICYNKATDPWGDYVIRSGESTSNRKSSITLNADAEYSYPTVKAVYDFVSDSKANWNSTSGMSEILNKPTKLSQFQNDSGFITNAAIQSLDSTISADSGYVLTGITETDGKLTGKTQMAIPTWISELTMSDQSYTYKHKLSIEIAAASNVIKGRDTEANIFALTGSRYGELWYATDTQKYYRKKNTTTTASSANWRDDTTVVIANMALPNQQTDEPYLYVKLNTNNKYYSKLCKFFTEAPYDNINGSTYITAYCRQTNQYKIEGCSYNGNKLVGIYQPSANTDIYYFKFAKFAGTYGADTQYSAKISIYTNFANNTPTIEFIGKNHADYATVNGYSYIACPAYGIHTTGIWQGLTPLANNAYDIGTTSYKWRNGYFSGTIQAVTFNENGTNLASKYLGISAKAADSNKLNGQLASYYLDYNNLTNKPTIPEMPTDYVKTGNVDQSIDGSKTFVKAVTAPEIIAKSGSLQGSIASDGSYVRIKRGTSTYMFLTSSGVEVNKDFTPATNNTYSFGSTSYKWKNFYLSGNLSDGTNSITIAKIENADNKTSVLSSSSTNTQYPGAKAVYDMIQEVREVAEGKTKTYVTNATQMPALGVTTNPVTVTSFKDKDGNVIDISAFKLGDNVYVEEVQWPDRWVSGVTTTSLTLNILESEKVPLSDYVPITRTINGHSLSTDITLTANDVGLGSVLTDILTLESTVSGHTSSISDLNSSVSNLNQNKQDKLTPGTNIAISSTNVISGPTKTSQLTNDSGFITAGEVGSNVLFVTYNSTTFAEITAGLNAGKLIICKKAKQQAIYRTSTTTTHTFSMVDDGRDTNFVCSNDNTWSIEYTNLQKTSLKDESIDSSSDNNHYPSSKAVYDIVSTKVEDANYVHTDNNFTNTYKSKIDSLKTVATSGSYNDLTDKPVIPTIPTNYVTTDTAQTISASKTFTAKNIFNSILQIGGTYKFGNTSYGCYEKRYLGTLNAGTSYANLDPVYKDGTWHRKWRIILPNDTTKSLQNFWGRLRITLFGTYSSFNASGVMSKTITCNYNAGSIYNNVGFYDSLGLNVEKDFRISEAIWNSTTSKWEIHVWQKNLNGNNSPTVMMETWHAVNANYQNIVENVTLSTVELTQETTYSALKASPTGGTKTVTWANDPVFESPLGYEILTSGNFKPGTGLTLSSGTLNHSNSVTAVTTASLIKVKYDAQGHITGSSAITKADITGLGIPAQDTTYNDATQSVHGLMSTADKIKLDGLVSNVQADWNATSGLAVILNKPTIPTVNNGQITVQMNGISKGSFTVNQSGNTTIDLGTIITDTSDLQPLITSSSKLSAGLISGLADVATTGRYSDLIGIPQNLVTTDGNQTISGQKIFSAQGDYTGFGISKTVNLSGSGYNMWARTDASNPILGFKVSSQIWYFQATSTNLYLGPTSTKALYMDANGNGGVPGNWSIGSGKQINTDKLVALTSGSRASNKYFATDGTIQTIPSAATVNDATISLKINGIVKGSFTTNQASDATIDLGTIAGGITPVIDLPSTLTTGSQVLYNGDVYYGDENSSVQKLAKLDYTESYPAWTTSDVGTDLSGKTVHFNNNNYYDGGYQYPGGINEDVILTTSGGYQIDLGGYNHQPDIKILKNGSEVQRIYSYGGVYTTHEYTFPSDAGTILYFGETSSTFASSNLINLNWVTLGNPAAGGSTKIYLPFFNQNNVEKKSGTYTGTEYSYNYSKVIMGDNGKLVVGLPYIPSVPANTKGVTDSIFDYALGYDSNYSTTINTLNTTSYCYPGEYTFRINSSTGGIPSQLSLSSIAASVNLRSTTTFYGGVSTSYGRQIKQTLFVSHSGTGTSATKIGRTFERLVGYENGSGSMSYGVWQEVLNVEANPTGTSVGTLSTLKVGNSIYTLPSGGGGSYTPGYGINISNNEISVDTSTILNITGDQTISGQKTFSSGIKLGSHWTVSEDSSGNLVFTTSSGTRKIKFSANGIDVTTS